MTANSKVKKREYAKTVEFMLKLYVNGDMDFQPEMEKIKNLFEDARDNPKSYNWKQARKKYLNLRDKAIARRDGISLAEARRHWPCKKPIEGIRKMIYLMNKVKVIQMPLKFDPTSELHPDDFYIQPEPVKLPENEVRMMPAKMRVLVRIVKDEPDYVDKVPVKEAIELFENWPSEL